MSDEQINDLIRRLRTNSGWWNGDQTARRVLAEAFAGADPDALQRANEAYKQCDEKLKDALVQLEKVRGLLLYMSSVCDDLKKKEAELREILRADPHSLQSTYAQRCDELDALARWKKEQLTVTAWWQAIDDYVRKSPDAPLGESVAAIALKWLQERRSALEHAISGELTNAGTMRVSDEENVTGYFVRCTVEELQRVKSLPMYRRVAIVEAPQ